MTGHSDSDHSDEEVDEESQDMEEIDLETLHVEEIKKTKKIEKHESTGSSTDMPSIISDTLLKIRSITESELAP